ncbi:MAG TPA: hypothetical protein DCY13_01290, partial [Verrucomicrobiales bacterium]|nr:hypothetical protein [Verrucomicrobiales bacterium]
LTRALFAPQNGQADAAPPEPAPLRMGDYELVEPIARGGMGVVYRARQRGLNREVAVKVLLHAAFAGDEERARFAEEAAAAARLRHPNIVAIHEIGTEDGQLFFSMDLIAGRDLGDLLGEGPMSPRSAAQLLATIGEAVQHAHEQGVMHRDLKPSNLLLGSRGEPFITDFGLAKRFSGDGMPSLTVTGQVIGTPGYMSPEQAAASRDVGPASDVYSLGAVLYHALVGRPPFVGETPTAILRQVEESDPVAPRILNPSVPRDLETITLRCLSKEPARRYPTARALAEDLQRFLRGEPVQARAVTLLERGVRWCRRRPRMAALAGVTLLSLLAVFIVVMHSNARLRLQRAQAEQVKNFLIEVIGAPDPTEDGRDVKVIDLLGRASERAFAELGGQPLVQAEVLSTLGNTYYQLSLYDQATPLLERALEIYLQELGPDAPETGEAHSLLGSHFTWAGELDRGEQHHVRAVGILRRAHSRPTLALANALSEYGSALLVRRRLAEAEPIIREAIALCDRLGTNALHIRASSLGDLSHSMEGDPERLPEAIRLLEESIHANRQLPGGRVNLATALSNLADWELLVSRHEAAEAHAREALALREELFGTNSSPAAFTRTRVAQVLSAQERYSAALEELERAIAIQRATLPPGHRDFQFSLRHLGHVLVRLDRPAEAETALREAIDILKQILDPEHDLIRMTGCTLAEALARQGKTAEARALLQQGLPAFEREAEIRPQSESHQRRLTVLRSLQKQLASR